MLAADGGTHSNSCAIVAVAVRARYGITHKRVKMRRRRSSAFLRCVLSLAFHQQTHIAILTTFDQMHNAHDFISALTSYP